MRAPRSSGRLRREVAERLGLPAGIPVAAGGADAGTGAVGVGCIENGEGFISLGTAAVFVVAADRYAPKPETMLHDFAHSVPGRWFQMAGMLNGASALSSMLQTIGETDIDAMLRAVEQPLPRPVAAPVPALSHRRADAPQQPRRPRRPLRPRSGDGEGRHRPGGARRRRLLAPRRGRVPRSRRQRLPFAGLHRRRRAEPVLGEDRRRRDRPDAPPLSRRRFRPGARRGAPGDHRRDRRSRSPTSASRPEVEEEIAPDPALFEAYTPRYEKFRDLYRSLAPLF